MAAALPESHQEILEENDEALLPEAELEEGDEFSSLDEMEPPVEAPAPAAKKPEAKKGKKEETAPVNDEDDDTALPEDLRGKTKKQLAEMYRQAQTLIGRQGSELGQFRSKADLLIQASLRNLQAQRAAPAAPAPAPAATEVDEAEFFRAPKKSVDQLVANHPVIAEIRKSLGQAAADRETQRMESNARRFNDAHPDASTISATPEFQEWIKASPIRKELWQKADQKFDFYAGDELFGTWKALNKKPTPPVEENVEVEGETPPAVDDAAARAAAQTLARRRQAGRNAQMPTGGSSGAPRVPASKKIFRRADVMKLMVEDPDRYDQLAQEIQLAYAEDRVR